MSFDGTDVLFFALLLPIAQLGLFVFIVYKGVVLLATVLTNMTELINILGEALVEEKQAYRRVRELIERMEKDGRFNG